ncbi:MAG: Ig-like domain-containing protein, partial [Candidatus Omnitrophota bacterium]
MLKRTLLATSVIVFISLIIMPTLLYAGEYTVFGPETYTRQRDNYSEDFSVSNTNDTFILRVSTEDFDISDLVPGKAVIKINGEKVLGAGDLKKNTTSIEKEITLTSENTIEIDTKGKPGGAIIVSIVGIDDVSPSIAITAPEGGATIDTNIPLINITYSDSSSGIDASSLEVLVDSTDHTTNFSMDSSGANWQITSSDALSDGEHTVQASISDNAGNSSTTNISFTVETVTPPEILPGSGFIHGYVYNSRTDAPIESAQITEKNIEGTALTNSDGKFTFPTSGTGKFYLTIKKTGFTYAQRIATVETTRDTAVEDIFLTPVDSQVTTITSAGGTATNSTGTVELIFPEGAVDLPIDVQATEYEKARELPGALPGNSIFTYAVDFLPDGVSFNKPVKFKLYNSRGFATGTPIPIGYYNKNTYQWEAVGMGVVLPGGEWAEFDITHFSPFDCNMASVFSDEAGGLEAQNATSEPKNEVDPGEARIGAKTGSVSIDYTLPSFRSLGKSTALTLTYNSNTVNPKILLSTEAMANPYLILQPETITFNINFGGFLKEVTFIGEEWDSVHRIMLEAKNARGETLPTGNYIYNVKLSDEFEAEFATAEYFGGPAIEGTGIFSDELESILTPISGTVSITNQTDSYFGSGWDLQGLQRLHFSPDDTILLTDGDGFGQTFRPELYAHSFLPDRTPDPECPYDLNIDRSVQSLDFDSQGNLYTIDTRGGRILKITPDNETTELATGLSGAKGIAVDSQDNIYVSVLYGPIYKITQSGEQSVFYDPPASLVFFYEITFDNNGNLYVVNSATSYRPSEILKITPEGEASVYAEAEGAFLGICFDDENNLYGSEMAFGSGPIGGPPTEFFGETRVFKVTPDGFLSTYAVGFIRPRGLVFDNETHILYVVDDWVHKIFKVTPDRLVEIAVLGHAWTGDTCFVGSKGFFSPIDVAFNNDGELFCTNSFSGARPYISMIGTVSRIKPSNTYLPPIGDYTLLSKNEDGTYTRLYKNGIIVNFDEEGFQTSIIDRNNNTTTFNYDENDMLIEIIDPVGQVTTFDYDTEGKLTKVTDPASRSTSFQMDANGDLVKITAPDGAITQYNYDENHLIARHTPPRGYATDYIYDEYGKIKEEVLPEADVLENGLLIRKREKTEFQPEETTGLINDLEEGTGTPENPAQAIKYADVKYQVTHGSSITTGVTNELGSLVEETDTLGNTTKIERDEYNNPTVIIKPNGLKTTFSYDVNGNMKQTGAYDINKSHPSSFFSMSFYYESKFNLLYDTWSSVRPLTRTCFKYDDYGNVILMGTPRGLSTLSELTYFTYDTKGLLTSTTDHLGNVTTFEYDTLGNLVKTTDALGNTTTLSYDSAGNVVSSTDTLGRTTTFTYDPMNRLTQVTDVDGNITTYEYDDNGNLIRVTDANGNSTTFEYNEVDELIRIINPNSETKQFFYDINRNLVRTIDGNGNLIEYKYDDLDRLIRKFLLGDVVNMSYDSVGNLTSIEDMDSKLVMEYNALGKLTKVDTGDSTNPNIIQPETTISYSYQYEIYPFPYHRNRLRMTDPEGGITTYEYDLYWNRLNSLTNPNGETINFGFDDLNRRSSLTLPNGITSDYTYDPLGQLTSLTSTVESLVYQYDAIGNRTRMDENDGINNYNYDDLNRLIDANHPQIFNPTEDFDYDPVGNRLRSHRSTSYTYNVCNRLTED